MTFNLKYVFVKKILLLFAFCLVFIAGYGQAGPVMTISLTTHNLGEIKEDGGPVAHNFVFLNSGKGYLKILNVKASCGCTSPEWTTDSIAPGQLGFIKVEFDPNNRPGRFSKTLTVTSNAEPAIQVLTIEGSVQKSTINPKVDYPVVIGKLRVRNRILALGNITTKEPVVSTFQIFNDSNDTIQLKDKSESPSHIRVMINPKTIYPGKAIDLTIVYNPKIKKSFGYVSDQILVSTTDGQDIKFHVNATIEEYFPPMTAEELSKAPVLSFDKVVQDFGPISQGSQARASIIFTNTGKDELNIRAIQPNCSCVKAFIDRENIKPGESGLLNLVFDTSGRVGYEQKAVAIFSNDPGAPTQVITVKGTVRD